MITIHGEIHSSKNSRRILPLKGGARPFVLAKSKQAKADESMIGYQLNAQRQEWDFMRTGMDYPLHVVFHFIRATNRRWDFANMVQGIADAMVEAGYIPDDDVTHFVPVFGGWQVDKESPGCDIWLQSERIPLWFEQPEQAAPA